MKDDPAIHIARNWYRNVGLVYNGIDFGQCIQYDVLQIINRSILREQERKAHADEQVDTVATENP